MDFLDIVTGNFHYSMHTVSKKEISLYHFYKLFVKNPIFLLFKTCVMLKQVPVWPVTQSETPTAGIMYSFEYPEIAI